MDDSWPSALGRGEAAALDHGRRRRSRAIAAYLFDEAPSHADELVKTLYDAPSTLLTFPHRGRVGKKAGTRELVVPGLPFIVVYRVDEQTIDVVRILHGAQRWP